jgi:hypothetical protein
MMDRLNNALMLGPFPVSGLALGGRTLIFTTPAVTLTLPGSSDSVVTLSSLLAALTAGVSGIHGALRKSDNPPSNYPSGVWFYLALWRDAGLVLTKDGTANSLFGLSTGASTTVKAPLSKDAVKAVSRTSTQEYECIVGGLDADFDTPSSDGTAQTGGSGNVVMP